eukprot:2556503-Pleurochrysis_carterae.AAC.1
MRRRDYFWNKLSQEERNRIIYNAIQFESVGGDLHSEEALGSASVRFLVGPTAGRQRSVCKYVFHANYPLSIPTINRIVVEMRNAAGVAASTAPAAEHRGRSGVHGEAHISNKTAHNIAWWQMYAEETSEELPDMGIWMTPHHSILPFACSQDFCKDCRSEGVPKMEICEENWFRRIFKEAPELCNITIASGKENFGRCSTFFRLEAEIKQAKASGDAQAVLNKKQERLDHHKLARADKLSYYAKRK